MSPLEILLAIFAIVFLCAYLFWFRRAREMERWVEHEVKNRKALEKAFSMKWPTEAYDIAQSVHEASRCHDMPCVFCEVGWLMGGPHVKRPTR